MATSIVATTPERVSTAEVRLDATINAAGELALGFNGDDLGTVNDNFEIKCDNDQIVKIIIANFEHGGSTWTVAATPKTRAGTGEDPWGEAAGTIYDEGTGHTDDYISVDVTATAGTSKTRRLHVKTKPRHSQPDPQMQQGG